MNIFNIFRKIYYGCKWQGPDKTWYWNGQPEWEALWENGKLTSIKRWYRNGKIEFERPFVNGKHGITRWWYKNGQIESEDYYLYGGKVTEEEFRKHELVVELAGIGGLDEKQQEND